MFYSALARLTGWTFLSLLSAHACAPRAPSPARAQLGPSAALPLGASPSNASRYISSEPIEPIHAPFTMATPTRPSIPPGVYDIRDFGAREGGGQKATAAFQAAIAEASRHGGGTVLVPPGVWLTGPIHLRNHINLHIARGAELRFSQDFADYLPPVLTRWEGQEVYGYSPLIYARDCHDVAVTGEGTLNGQGAAWWPWKETQEPAAKELYELASRGAPPEQRVLASVGGLRPSFVQTVGCQNVLVEGVTLRNGPFWTIHPVYSENVIVRRVRVETRGPNGDGCDPDSSKNVLIEDSSFSTGDDCVVIKSGLNEDGWRVGKPSENIVVRRVRGESGHGGVVIGSEMSGGVRSVWVTDSEFIGTDRGLRIKSLRGRGGSVEGVFYENVRHQGLRLVVVEITSFYGSSTLIPRSSEPPRLADIHIKNVTARGARQAIDIVGLPEAPVRNVTFENVDIIAEQGVHCVDCVNVRFDNVSLRSPAGVNFSVENVLAPGTAQ